MPQRHWHDDWDDAPRDELDPDADPDADDLDDEDASDDEDDGDDEGADDDEPADDDEDDDSLDEDFPLGDGTADTSTILLCPYCGEENEIAVDPGGGGTQHYVEDCHVCCRPWRVTVIYDEQGGATAWADTSD